MGTAETTFHGARCVVRVNGIRIAHMTDVNSNATIMTQAIETAGTPIDEGHVITGLKVEFSAGIVRQVDPAKLLETVGLIPRLDDPQALLNWPDAVIVMEDVVTGKTLSKYNKAKPTSLGSSVPARGIARRDMRWVAVSETNKN